MVKVLTDEDKFLHTVAVLVIPVFAQLRIICHELHQFLFGHRSKPLTGLTEVELFACLLEEIAHIVFLCEITHTLATNDILRPVRRYELIEESKVKRLTREIYKGIDAKFSQVVMTFVVMIVIVVMMLVLIVIVVVIVFLIVMVVMMRCIFHFLNPSGRSSGAVEIKKIGIQQFIEFYIAEVRLDNLCRGLYGADDGFDTRKLFGAHLFRLVLRHG